jgi:hypothetical protein
MLINMKIPGYARIIPSGILNPLFMAITVTAETKFPPAESPIRMIFLGLILRCS